VPRKPRRRKRTSDDAGLTLVLNLLLVLDALLLFLILTESASR